MNVLFAQILQSLDIVCNVQVAVSASGLDIIMNINTFNAGNVKSGSFYFVLQGADTFTAPNLSGSCIIQRSDDTGYTRNLADLPQFYRVKL